MAEDTTDLNQSGTISRPALGRIANLGDLYDVTTDRFCATSIFNEMLPSNSPAINVRDNSHSKISLTTFSSFEEKLKELDVTGALKLSVLAGMIELGGSAKYLNKKKSSFKSVESALLYNIKTKVERINLYNDDVKRIISKDAMLQSGATHVVVQIYWGANCTVIVTDENSEEKEEKEVKGSLKLELSKLKQMIAIGGELSGKSAKENFDDENRFSLEIFGDVLLDSSDEFPDTLEGAVAMMNRIPLLIQKSNNGKGIPLIYVMIPLSSPAFKSYLGDSRLKIPAVSNLGEGQIVQVIHLFDYMSELQQKAHDLVDELNDHGHCVTRNELREARSYERSLKAQQGTARDELAKLLVKVRSDNSDEGGCVEDFCKKYYDIAEKTFQQCEMKHKPQQKQIEFAKRCKKFGAKYLSPPIEERIASACDVYGNVYVLFDGEFDRETDGETDRKTLLRRNHSAFIELAKSCQNVDCLNADKTVCYVAWPEQRENVAKEHVRIEHYRKGKLVDGDVIKELETENVAQCIPAARRAFSLMPFKVVCPGSFDGYCSREELSWRCINCKESLQFCPDDRGIYCSCGHSRADRFQFRCHNETHGLDFCKFSDDLLQSALDHHASLARKGIYLIK